MRDVDGIPERVIARSKSELKGPIVGELGGKPGAAFAVNLAIKIGKRIFTDKAEKFVELLDLVKGAVLPLGFNP